MSDEFDTAVGRKVRELRKERRLTQAVVAEVMHVGRPHLSLIERGVRPLSLVAATRLAAHLGCSVDDIIAPASGLEDIQASAG